MKILCAQINPTVGDIAGNSKLMLNAYNKAISEQAELVLLPELAICGYPPQDLLLRPDFLIKIKDEVENIIEQTNEVGLLLSTPWIVENKIFNSVLLIQNKEIKQVINKTHLPNYGVFDEKRYFSPANENNIIELNGTKIGIPICEDAWMEDICQNLANQGAEILLIPNASPYETDKLFERQDAILDRAEENNIPIVYLNLVGGQDDILFDGASFAINSSGEICNQQPNFEESYFIVDSENLTPNTSKQPNELDEVYKGLTLAIKDYCHKSGFKQAVLGLSGGIDSALVATLAVGALGKENVKCLLMPSVYTSDESINDATKLAKNLGVELINCPINEGVEALHNSLTTALNGIPKGLTAENLQARLRGIMLMAYSNNTGELLLTTGNKSEMAVGYATLYGDMNGGFNPIKDVYKTQVFELCKFINRDEEIIPANIINKPPSAELAPNQKDEDNLPPYETLDAILELAIEEHLDAPSIIDQGFETETVNHVLKLFKNAEYKRDQAVIGPKITKVAFGADWRMPLVNKNC